ncbi:MAG: nucleotidyltransferase domain-containing protein [Bacteroidetes bacterium]|nr:nucleotidyltransferase domain-containing protein [Bacteroidota bacterium]
MDKRTFKIIANYIEYIRGKNIPIKKAYLFGSYARNSYSTNSDIDLALILGELTPENKFDTQVQLLLLASDIDTRIEPHPFGLKDFNHSNPFASEIIKTGIEVL